ncbi:MAG TPA: glycosyltransferase family 2 protein [Candidatus Hydrothermia bacterium]|nr:glycosyltransferase family 2 protein [Candidatus Hydrothermia bacterium]
MARYKDNIAFLNLRIYNDNVNMAYRRLEREIRYFISNKLFDEKILLSKSPAFPKISIVTPSYNQGEFLEKAILSVLNQNYPNLEYIIIDGGSTDGSVDIIKKYEKYLAYWVSEKDKGQSHALNKGFSRCSGELLMWINADDILLPGALFKIVECFRKHPSTDVIYGDYFYIDVNDAIIRKAVSASFNRKAFLLGELNLGCQSSVCWRRGVFMTVGMVNEDCYYGMDFVLYLKFLKYGARFRYLPSVLGAFRIHSGSKTGRKIIKKENMPSESGEYLYKLFGIHVTKEVQLLRYGYKIRRALQMLLRLEFRYMIDALIAKLKPEPFSNDENY